MSKQFRIATAPDMLKPVIEAMIFASEEPLSARALLRLLAGDRDSGPRADGADREESRKERASDREAAATEKMREGEPASVETIDDLVEEPDVETDSVAGPGVASAADEVEASAGEVADDAEKDSAIGRQAEDAADVMNAGMVGGTIEIAGETAAGPDDERMNEPETGPVRDSQRRHREFPDTIDQAYLRTLIDELNDEYEASGRVFRIVEVAGGFQFATIREYGEFVAMLSKDKARRRLSPAALETLAMIAYRQPVSKPEVEAIRGVNCDQVLLSLMEKNLVAITGRSESVGRPLLYSTTEEFLRIFGLKGLGDLPKLREIEELMEEDAYSAERAEVITVGEDTDVEEIEAKVGAAGHHAEKEPEGDDGLPAERGESEPDAAVEDDVNDEIEATADEETEEQQGNAADAGEPEREDSDEEPDRMQMNGVHEAANGTVEDLEEEEREGAGEMAHDKRVA